MDTSLLCFFYYKASIGGVHHVYEPGQEVVYLNQPRYVKVTPLSLRFPLEEDDPACMAARGEEGPVEALDYRGEKVLAAMRPVPGSSWYVVVKEDISEVFGSLALLAWITGISVFLLFASLSFLSAFLWYRRVSAFYRKEFRLEAEKRALAEHYAYLTRYANDIILLLDPEGKIVEANERALETYGYGKDELIGRAAEILLPAGEEWPRPDEKEGEGIIYEALHRRRDGTLFPVEVSARLIRWEEREYHQAIIRDITERKTMEEELKEKEVFLRRLTDNMMDIVSQVDPEGRVVFISPSVKRVLGYEPEEIVGREIRMLIHPLEWERIKPVYEKSRRHLLPGKVEHRAWSKTGRLLWLETVGTPILDERGRLLGAVFASRDITDRKAVEETLQGMAQCFLSLGPSPRKNMEKITSRAREITGWDRAEYCRPVGDGLEIFASTEEGGRWERSGDSASSLFGGVLVGGGREILYIKDLPERGYRGFPASAAEEGYLCWAGCPVPADETAAGLLGLYGLVHRELREFECNVLEVFSRALAVEEERLEYQEGLKDFIDIASHELRHPMTIVKGYTDTLLERWTDLSEELRRDFLRNIARSTERLAKLVSELLDTARIERRKLALQKESLNMEEVARQAVGELRDRGVPNEFHLRFSSYLPPVHADEEKILRVLVILLDNAVNYSPPGSVVEVTGEAEKDGTVTVSVLDRGPGVSDEDRERIFERFYQGEEPAHHSRTGIGLGLYIARWIVEAHGGRIWYEPRPGGGSIFRFTLPPPGEPLPPASRNGTNP
jgi:PAS domain S-box-containing protein